MVIDLDFMGRVRAAQKKPDNLFRSERSDVPRLAQNACQAKYDGKRFPPASAPARDAYTPASTPTAEQKLERCKADLDAALKAISAANAEIDRLNAELSKKSDENKGLVLKCASLENTVSELKAQKPQFGGSKKRRRQEQKAEGVAPVSAQPVQG